MAYAATFNFNPEPGTARTRCLLREGRAIRGHQRPHLPRLRRQPLVLPQRHAPYTYTHATSNPDSYSDAESNSEPYSDTDPNPDPYSYTNADPSNCLTL